MKAYGGPDVVADGEVVQADPPRKLVDRAPTTAGQVSGKIPKAGGGWAFILSDLKTLLETGKALGG